MEMIYRATTAVIKIPVDDVIDLNSDSFILTIRQSGEDAINFTEADVSTSGKIFFDPMTHSVCVKLTQEETKNFSPSGYRLKCQIRYTKGEDVIASNIVNYDVGETLNDTIIVPGGTPTDNPEEEETFPISGE